MSSSFPIGSSVLLQNLVKGAHLNDKKGIVKARPDAVTGRQEVYVFEAQKSMAIKPANLRYEPRELSSLSVSEMKGILLKSKKIDDDASPTEWKGMTKEELLRTVAAEIDTEDPGEIAALVAEANAPVEGANNRAKVVPDRTTGGGDAALQSSERLRQGAEVMSKMSPNDIRRQAATMKAMGPAALRACTPQMAGMTDAQINMAISQMEAVANNPTQLKMAADQMKSMSDSQLRQAVNQSPLSSQSGQMPRATPATPSTNNHAAAAAAAPPSVNNISQSQFQQATQQMSSMSPDQLKSQAAMLKSMPLDALRRSNPQMANMSDAQIRMSITQLEQMAENPDMVKMAADQMKNMTKEQYDGLRDMMGGGGSGPSAAGETAAGMAGMPADPSKMMESLLSNPDQLNTAVKMMKKNPEMIKQMMASQLGTGGGGGDGSSGGDAPADTRQKQMNSVIDSFAEMDDEKLEKYLKLANKVQTVAGPMWNAFDRVKQTLGVSTKTLIVSINILILAGFVLLARWWRMRGSGIETEGDIMAHDEGVSPPAIFDYENEF